MCLNTLLRTCYGVATMGLSTDGIVMPGKIANIVSAERSNVLMRTCFRRSLDWLIDRWLVMPGIMYAYDVCRHDRDGSVDDQMSIYRTM